MAASESQTVFITGASRGLGRALAAEFAKRGARLVLLDLPGVEWGSVGAELQGLGSAQVHLVSADVTSPEQLTEAIRTAGRIDLLIANAGVGLDTPAVPFPVEDFKKQVDINLTGVANSIAAVLPGMLERGKGHLVAIASLAGYRGLLGLAGYSASKAGVIALMESLRVELRQHGIRCTTVCPGWINTGVLHTMTAAKPGVVPLDVAARKIAAGIGRRRGLIAFPLWLRVLFVLNRLQPPWASDWMLRLFWRWFGGR